MQSVRVRPVQVFLIAPPMVCWGLERLVQTAHPRMELTGSSASLATSLEPMQKMPPDVIVADLDGAGGFDALAEINARIGARVLIVTSSQDVAVLDRAV